MSYMNPYEFETAFINVINLVLLTAPEKSVTLEIKPIDSVPGQNHYHLYTTEANSNIIRIWPNNRISLAYTEFSEAASTDEAFLYQVLVALDTLTGPYFEYYQDILMTIMSQPLPEGIDT